MSGQLQLCSKVAHNFVCFTSQWIPETKYGIASQRSLFSFPSIYTIFNRFILRSRLSSRATCNLKPDRLNGFSKRIAENERGRHCVSPLWSTLICQAITFEKAFIRICISRFSQLHAILSYWFFVFIEYHTKKTVLL